MSAELEEFHREFINRVHTAADADGRYAEDAFFELFCESLVDAGEMDAADRTPFLAPRGIRVDGYGGDPAESEGVLNLIIADFQQSDELRTLTGTEMDAIFNRLQQFLTKSLDPVFRNSLEESDAAFGLADLIAARWAGVNRVRFFLISNRVLSSRVDGRPAGEVQHVTTTFSVWDIGRLHRFVVSGHGREPIDIELAEYGGPVASLPAHLDGAGYGAYLVVLPGRQLAAIYDRWGARLLEQNVRCFLQAKGNVNKGIRNTIESNPEMFFAYNNGITATAESVEATGTSSGLILTRLRNLQIVNGGQTTASIHAASRKKDVDLSKVFVQMKLSIIPPAHALDVVPKISEYANSQNRVNAADFFANHPFHVRIEEFSRRILAPSPDGTFRQSKWFYERARGQYQDARAYLSVSEKKQFDMEFPHRQLISKTDLAKFLNVWLEHPHIVSQGAQKNFAHFADYIGKEWAKSSDAFNEMYYRQAIAKAIVFREVERLVTQQPWYQGGYRANVVAYTISKVSHDVRGAGCSIDFEGIWKRQGLSSAQRDAFVLVATAVHDVIVDPAPGISNVTEWAKKLGCWQRVMDLSVALPVSFRKELIGRGEERTLARAAVRDQRLLTGVEAMMEVARRGGPFWKSVRDWGVANKSLSLKEIELLDRAAEFPQKQLSDKQSLVVVTAFNKLRSEGCPLGD